MRVSWDKKIILATVLFMAFMVGMGVVMVLKDNELYEENYYEKDLSFEKELQAKKNAIKFNILPSIVFEKSTLNIVVNLSKMQQQPDLKATILFQKPNNTKLNFELPLSLDDNFLQNIPTADIPKGVWNIWIEGKIGDTAIKTTLQKIEIY